jgi:hypothetical protein
MRSAYEVARVSSQEFVEPAAVVAAMAVAVARIRRMAVTVFQDDAALFTRPPRRMARTL